MAKSSSCFYVKSREGFFGNHTSPFFKNRFGRGAVYNSNNNFYLLQKLLLYKKVSKFNIRITCKKSVSSLKRQKSFTNSECWASLGLLQIILSWSRTTFGCLGNTLGWFWVTFGWSRTTFGWLWIILSWSRTTSGLWLPSEYFGLILGHFWMV